MNRRVTARFGLALAGIAVTSALFINLCHLIYQCGCEAWWAAAADHCNIQQAGHPDCPWCQHGGMPGGVAYALIVVTQLAVAFWPGPVRWVQRGLVVLAAFPVVGALVGGMAGLWFNYWR